MSERVPLPGPPRPSSRIGLVLSLALVGTGSLVAAGVAAERGAERGLAGGNAPGVSPASAGADTTTPPPPPPWAIPPLRPARVEVRWPTAPAQGAEGEGLLPPLVRLVTADAGPAPGSPDQPADRPALPAPVPLSAAEVEGVLAPLPDLSALGPDQADDIGAATGVATGVATGAARVRDRASMGGAPDEPPRVLGVFPSGEAEVVPDVTVVFSHPVVPLGAVGEAAFVPFRWEPAVAGSWHWLDATTARFLPRDGRLPGGQSYRLVVDPDLGGTAAGRIAAPAPHEAHLRIRGPLALGGSGEGLILPTTPILVLGFDQAMDPDVVAAYTSFRILGDSLDARPGAPVGSQVVPAAARALDDAPERDRDAVRSGRYAGAVALSPASPLPRGAWVRLEVGPELTSIEGPLATGRRQELVFRTAETFRFTGSPCGSTGAACTPEGTHTLDFSNPVDASQPLEERIRVTPEVPGLQLRTTRTGELRLHGPFQPWTSYRIRVDGDLTDIFGAPLGAPVELSVHFGRPSALLSIRGAPFVSLDPAGARELEIPVRGLDRVTVRIFAADPARWDPWGPGSPGFQGSPHALAEGLEELESLDLTPDDGGEGFSFLHVPLADALEAARGQVAVLVSGYRDAAGSGEATDAPNPEVVAGAWVQLPSLRLQLLGDADRLVVHARTLGGTPAAGVRLDFPQAGVEGTTDAEGFASISFSAAEVRDAGLLVAEADGRITLVPSAPAGRRFPRWIGEEGAPGPLWAASLDRPLYQSGDPLAVQGWVQEVVSGAARDVRAPEQIRAIRYEVVVPGAGGSGRRTAHAGEIEVSPSGGFHFLVDLPDDLEPGYGGVLLTALGEDASGAPLAGPRWTRELGLRTADFRRPDYEVSVSLPPEVLYQDEPFHVAAEARYFGGPGLPGSELRWTLAPRRGSYAPPGWQNPISSPNAGSGTPTGPQERWRFTSATRTPYAWRPNTRSTDPVVHEARTDAAGLHRLQVTPSEVADPFPLTLVASVTVQDLNRQAGSASATAILLPGRALPGIRVIPLASTPSGRLVVGDSVEVEVVVLDAEGGIVPADRRARPEVSVERLGLDPDSERYFQRWLTELAAPVRCQPARVPAPRGSPHGPTVEGYRCRAPLPEAGEWLAAVTVSDDAGRESRAEANFSVLATGVGPGGWSETGRGLAGFGVLGATGEVLELELDGRDPSDEEVLPGDTVTLRIRAPFAGGHGMAALDHGGIRRFLPVDLEAGQTEHRIRFPVEGAPGSRTVEVLLESSEGDRGASGQVGFEVAPEARRLALTVGAPPERVEPGATVPVAVTVTGDGGVPVAGAEVTIWLVDEAALFAAGSDADVYTAEGLDPWESFYEGARGIRSRGGLWLHTLRERRPPGDGVLQGRLLHAFTGAVASGSLEVTGSDGVARSYRLDASGEVHVANLPPGDLQIRFVHPGNDIALDRMVAREGDEGVELGTLLLRPRIPIQEDPQVGAMVMMRARVPGAPDDLPPPSEQRTLAFEAVSVSATTFPDIEVPAPPSTGSGYLRQDFTPLAGLAPRVVTGEDGVARTTFRLPDTLTRYRILAVARSGTEGPSVGAGEGLVVAGRDLVVRATPPRFLRSGDQGEISLLVENGSDADREVEVALRTRGLALEGSGGVRLHVPAGDRREVRIPTTALLPGMAEIQARAVSGAFSDAVGMEVAVQVPVAPERMAFRTLLEPGVPRIVVLEPSAAVSPAWGGLEVVVSPSLAGGMGGELLALAETTLPWAGLRIARVRGAAALARARERDPALAASLDSAALATLHRTVDEDMAALSRALRRVRTIGTASEAAAVLAPAAQAMGSWTPFAVLEASQALDEARQAGLIPHAREPRAPAPPAPLDPALLRSLLGGLARPDAAPDPGDRAAGLETLELAILWTLHRSGPGVSILPMSTWQTLATLDTEAVRPLWLARIAAMVARAEVEGAQAGLRGSAIPVGTHQRFLEALENRAMITPGGVTFRRGAPLPGAAAPGFEGEAFQFSASSPAEDAEVLLALVEVAPDHPLLAGLVASVAGPEEVGEGSVSGGVSGGAPWGPEVAGRALPALEAWAQLQVRGSVDTRVALALGGIPGVDSSAGPSEASPLRVRSGEPSQLRWVPMARLLEAQAAADGEGGALLSLPVSLEAGDPDAGATGGGTADRPGREVVSARVLLSWTAADPFQPAMIRGFVVRRSYEGVDDPDDVLRDADGTWRIRAGARVRVVHELLLPERRLDVRLEDPFPAGFEPVQGTAGGEGAGRAPSAAGSDILLDGRWGLAGGTGYLLGLPGARWYREILFARDQATAWAPFLPPGTYRGDWVARATLPGDYIVPGVRAYEAGRPDVMGRSEAHRVVVEER